MPVERVKIKTNAYVDRLEWACAERWAACRE
jgi:hypothetical protein